MEFDKLQNISLNSEIEISKIDEKEDLLINNFEKFINDVRENMNKCRFRKCLDDIKDKELLFSEYKNNWKITEMKIKCMLKIINKKFIKYTGGNLISSKIKGLENWLLRVDNEVEKWFENLINKEISLDEENIKDQIEVCIKVVLDQCYNYALCARSEKHIADCAGFLALGERLIKYTSDFTNNPDTLNITQKMILKLLNYINRNHLNYHIKNYIFGLILMKELTFLH